VIDEATKYVQFWDQRYKTLQALAPSESSLLENRNAALIEIDGATAFLTGRIQRILGATEAPKPIPTNKIRRWYMLYKPNKWTSWLVRLFFYIYAFMGIVVGVELLGFAIVGFEDMPRLLALALAPVVPVVCYAVAWPMRLLAEWFDQRQKSNFALVTGSFTTEGVSATQPRKSAVGA
jgi:hypothetical protein